MADKYTVTSGTNLNYEDAATWSPISLRNTALQWTASGSGTGEYYLEATGGGNPTGVISGFVEPSAVQENGTAMTAGTAGSLTASQWDWADNDTLGFSTVYARLADDTDPDTKTDGYVTFTDSPNANDNVYIRGAVSIVGSDQSGTELDDFIVLPGFTGTLGTADSYLKIDMADADRFEFTATGTCYIDLGDAAVSPIVNRTASAANGQAGLYLKGSALNDLFVRGGTAKLVGASVDDAYVYSGGSLIGDTDTDCTADIHNNGGTITWDGTGVDFFNQSGTATINGSDAWAVVECNAGTVTCNTSGTVTAANATNSGTIDLTKSSLTRTVTTPKVEGQGKIIYDPALVTMTNVTSGDGPKVIKGGTS